jgi:predicted amidohydrolase
VTRIAVCQLAGRPLEEAADALAACEALVAEAARAGAELAVVPEGAYPAYVLGSGEVARAALSAGPDPLEAFGAMARAGGLTLVAGLVVEDAGGLRNAAVAFAPDGSVIGRTAKRFLWHFDTRWFAAGCDYPVWDSAVGPLGALVCADARLPEIARTLAVRGAALICDPTAWVTSTPRNPWNPQPDYLVSARALENGVVVAAASKCGFEGNAVAYAGRSLVMGPDGAVVAEASVDGEEVVVADVDLTGLPRPPVARRPELYAALAETTPPASPSPSAQRVRVAAANGAEVAAAPHLASLSAHGVSLVVVPAGEPADLAQGTGLWVAGVDRAGDGVVASPDGVVARFPRAHGPGAAASWLAPPVPTPGGRVAVLAGVDALVPEQARVAALEGAEVLIVPAPGIPLAVLRARASENRVFVVAAGDPAVVIAPNAAVLADAPDGRPFLCSADLFLPEAADKEVAPWTDMLAGRQPSHYADLVRSR